MVILSEHLNPTTTATKRGRASSSLALRTSSNTSNNRQSSPTNLCAKDDTTVASCTTATTVSSVSMTGFDEEADDVNYAALAMISSKTLEALEVAASTGQTPRRSASHSMIHLMEDEALNELEQAEQQQRKRRNQQTGFAQRSRSDRNLMGRSKSPLAIRTNSAANGLPPAAIFHRSNTPPRASIPSQQRELELAGQQQQQQQQRNRRSRQTGSARRSRSDQNLMGRSKSPLAIRTKSKANALFPAAILHRSNTTPRASIPPPSQLARSPLQLEHSRSLGDLDTGSDDKDEDLFFPKIGAFSRSASFATLKSFCPLESMSDHDLEDEYEEEDEDEDEDEEEGMEVLDVSRVSYSMNDDSQGVLLHDLEKELRLDRFRTHDSPDALGRTIHGALPMTKTFAKTGKTFLNNVCSLRKWGKSTAPLRSQDMDDLDDLERELAMNRNELKPDRFLIHDSIDALGRTIHGALPVTETFTKNIGTAQDMARIGVTGETFIKNVRYLRKGGKSTAPLRSQAMDDLDSLERELAMNWNEQKPDRFLIHDSIDALGRTIHGALPVTKTFAKNIGTAQDMARIGVTGETFIKNIRYLREGGKSTVPLRSQDMDDLDSLERELAINHYDTFHQDRASSPDSLGKTKHGVYESLANGIGSILTKLQRR